MNADLAIKAMRSWIRSQHLICFGQEFIFETVDQTQLERFESCLSVLGGEVRVVRAIGNWPMGPNRSFKILQAAAGIPPPVCQKLQQYWAAHGSTQTRYAEINS